MGKLELYTRQAVYILTFSDRSKNGINRAKLPEKRYIEQQRDEFQRRRQQ